MHRSAACDPRARAGSFRRGRCGALRIRLVTVVFVFFSVPRGKLAPYILPLFPPLALLLGDALDRWLDGRVTIRAMPRAFATVGVGLLVAIAALPVALHFSPVRIPPAFVVLAS